MKNYIVFVNDHSGSMSNIAAAAIKDYNANIEAVVNAANMEKLDTVVSVIALGMPAGDQVTREVVISNPHVLRPKTKWPTPGGTPLFDAIGNGIELMESLPDARDPNVSFLFVITTDGEEMHSRHYNRSRLGAKISQLNMDGRWTFTCRVPRGTTFRFDGLGIPSGNIQEWETTTAGMERATVATTQAMGSYFSSRAAGNKSTTVFYANAANLNTKQLVEIPLKAPETSLYVVPHADNGIQIRDFVLQHRQEYLKGAAFYQLTKTEARVQPTKEIVIRDRSTGKFYGGKEARQAIGLDTVNNARLHPGNHGNYDIFIQSESTNRKLVGGTGVFYWKSKGTSFTQEELDKFAGKQAGPAVVNGVVQLPQVAPTNKPTPSPIPKTPKAPTPINVVNGRAVTTFLTRDEARAVAKSLGRSVQDAKLWKITHLANRWFIFN